MENKGVKCDVCECVHNTAGCGCDRSVIEVKFQLNLMIVLMKYMNTIIF